MNSEPLPPELMENDAEAVEAVVGFYGDTLELYIRIASHAPKPEPLEPELVAELLRRHAKP